METKIVQWVHCDNKIKEYNKKIKDKTKPIKEMKDKLSKEILSELNISESEKSNIPVFNIQSMNVSITPHVCNTYENYTNKFYKECFSEFLGSEEKAEELIVFMKNKRKIEKKISLKRDILMDLND